GGGRETKKEGVHSARPLRRIRPTQWVSGGGGLLLCVARVVRRVDVLELDRALSVEQDGRRPLRVGVVVRIGRHEGEASGAERVSGFLVQLVAHSHVESARD